MTNVLAVDLGGTNFRMAVVDPAGTIVAREVLPTKEAGSVGDGVRRLIEALNAGDLDTLVFGAPGVVDYREGRVVFAPNLDRELLAELSVAELERATGAKVLLVNDADLAAVGEARIGAGRDAGTVLYLTCSTGVGAGLVTNGRLLRSRYSTMEAGHTRLGLERVDEAEALASGTALARMAREAGLSLDNPALVRAAAASVGLEREVLERVTEALGTLIGNLSWLVAPDRIVVGGGLGLADPIVLELARKAFAAVVPSFLRGVDLEPAELGDDAGLRGSAFIHEALAQ